METTRGFNSKLIIGENDTRQSHSSNIGLYSYIICVVEQKKNYIIYALFRKLVLCFSQSHCFNLYLKQNYIVVIIILNNFSFLGFLKAAFGMGHEP